MSRLSVGINESLAVPGVSPAAVSGAEQANQLERALGLTVTSLGNIGQIRRQQELLDDREKRAVEIADRGLATRNANEALPSLLSSIDDRSLLTGDGEGAIESWVDQRIAKDTEGHSQAYADQYRAVMAPHLLTALYRQRQGIVNEARAEDVGLASDLIAGMTDPAEINKIVAQKHEQYPTVQESVLTASLLLPGLDAAARAGNREGFDAIAGVIGSRFPDKVTSARYTLENRIDAQQNEAYQTTKDIGLRMLAGGDPLELVDDYATRMLQENKLRPGDALELQSRIREERTRQNKFDIHAFTTTAKSQRVQSIMPALRSGGQALVQDYEIQRPDGTTVTYTRKDQLEDAYAQERQSIEQQYKDQPTAQLAARLDYLSRVPDLKDHELEAAWSGVSRRVTSAFDVQNAAPIVAAYNLWKASGVAPGVRDDHMTREDAEFFKLVDFINTYQPGSTVESSIGTVAKMMQMSGLPASQRTVVPETQIIKGLRGVVDPEDANFADALNVVQNLASVYATIGGSYQQAIDHAVKDFKGSWSKVNGYWVQATGPAGRTVAAVGIPGLETASNDIARYWDSIDNDTSHGPQDYTLAPLTDDTGRWGLKSKRTGQFLYDERTIFDQQELGFLVTYPTLLQADMAEAKLIEDANATGKRRNAERIASEQSAKGNYMRADTVAYMLEKLGPNNAGGPPAPERQPRSRITEHPIPQRLRAIIQFLGTKAPARSASTVLGEALTQGGYAGP